jgi:transcriptional regulator with XRE-family HTH domain
VRQAIREAFHFSLVQIANRPQMTARRVHGLERGKAPHPSAAPCLRASRARRLHQSPREIARAHGPLPPPPPELQNQSIQIEFVSPFVQVQKAAKAKNAL